MTDEVCIIISKDDVIIFPFEIFCRLLVQVVDISEQPITCFSDATVLGPACLLDEVGFIEDSLDLTRGLHFWSVILWSRPPIVDIDLKVPEKDKLFYLILQGDTLLSGVADVSMRSTKLVLVPFESISI